MLTSLCIAPKNRAVTDTAAIPPCCKSKVLGYLTEIILNSYIAKDNMLTILHHDNHLKIISHEMGIKTVDFL